MDDLLVKILKKGYSIAGIAKETGIPYARIDKWKKGKGNPKREDSEKLEQLLSKIEQVPRETPPEAKLSPLDALIKSNQDLAESNNILARSHERLVMMLAANSGVDQESTALTHAIAKVLLKVGVKADYWTTVEAGQKELGKEAAGLLTGKKAVRS
jgi:transcriptional regulator with XRE-family HTH domain